MLNRILVAIGLFCLAATGAQAQSVDDILKRGTLIIGTGLSSPPHGYMNKDMQPEGFDVDLAGLVAKHLGVKLQIVDVTLASRIPNLLNNKVDLIISGFVVTPERALQVAFTNPYSSDKVEILAAKSTSIKAVEDTKTLRVAVPRGTMQDLMFTAAAPAGAQILRFDTDQQQALLSGQADALVTAHTNALDLIRRNPDKNFEIKLTMAETPLAIGLRRGQQDLLNWLNTCIFYMKYSGELEALHKKYDLPYSLPVF